MRTAVPPYRLIDKPFTKVDHSVTLTETGGYGRTERVLLGWFGELHGSGEPRMDLHGLWEEDRIWCGRWLPLGVRAIGI
jgi:hypothetical protein